MNIRLVNLTVRTRQTTEEIRFAETVTFLYGTIGTGKSTVARLIDYCFGGVLERTPAIQQEFISVILGARLGEYECTFERGAEDTQAVRVTWIRGEENGESVSAPLRPGEVPLLDAEVYNLSDLLFYLCGVEPIKVLRRTRDPESPVIRLSFRDIWWYCYLDQTHLDSSFFRLDIPYKDRKSQDAMRFFTGLHSERLSQLQADLYRTITQQQSAREAVVQIRRFMTRFDLGSELDFASQIESNERELRAAEERKLSLEANRTISLHPTDELRERLRVLSRTVSDLTEAIYASRKAIDEQESLRAELITTKFKAERARQAGIILDGVDYSRCPQCGTDISERSRIAEQCRLCGTSRTEAEDRPSIESEAMQREINDRIDQITDSLNRRRPSLEMSQRELQRAESAKELLDRQLSNELERYDSAYVESVRRVDREIGTLVERNRSLMQLQEMPRAINALEEQGGALQGQIDRLRSALEEERGHLRVADENARAVSSKFKSIMLDVGFPGVSEEDEIVLDPRNWKPIVVHDGQEWGFWDTGSGGKKTLFNVCYALALHMVARERGMPVPNLLIIDSPTKNISDDENPELVDALYREIYRFAAIANGAGTQFLLIDSNLVEPAVELSHFTHRRLAGEPEAPSLISYYTGP